MDTASLMLPARLTVNSTKKLAGPHQVFIAYAALGKSLESGDFLNYPRLVNLVNILSYELLDLL